MTLSIYHSLTFHTLHLSLLHLIVDGICACGLMLMSRYIISDFEANAMIVLYNILAFGTQPLTGKWVDGSGSASEKLKMAVVLLACGASVSLLSAYFTVLSAVIGTIMLGMGNSLFHVYGGKCVAVVSRYDIRAMGVFVSTGAVGLAIGLGFSSPMLMVYFLLALLALSFLHLYIVNKQNITIQAQRYTGNSTNAEQSSAHGSVPFPYLACLMLVVAGRACIGEAVPSLRTSLQSMSAPMMMVVVSLVVMVGKAAGGFLSKRWGVRRVFTFSMLLSATFFLMCPWHDGLVLATLILINLSMPCTLYLATKAVPGREGWAFGLLAMAILPGFLIGFLSKDNVTCQSLLVPLVATVLLESFLLLYMRERRWQVLAASVVINIFTNVPLNAFIMSYSITSPFYIIGLECMVVAVEFVGYWLVLHDRHRAFKYSILCNAFSAVVGFLCQLFSGSLYC